MEIAERIQFEDKADDNKVALYLFEKVIDGERFGGQIPAKSWKDAQQQIYPFGGVVVGLVSETLLEKPCAICGGEIRFNQEHFNGVPDKEEFPDFIK